MENVSGQLLYLLPKNHEVYAVRSNSVTTTRFSRLVSRLQRHHLWHEIITWYVISTIRAGWMDMVAHWNDSICLPTISFSLSFVRIYYKSRCAVFGTQNWSSSHVHDGHRRPPMQHCAGVSKSDPVSMTWIERQRLVSFHCLYSKQRKQLFQISNVTMLSTAHTSKDNFEVLGPFPSVWRSWDLQQIPGLFMAS